MEAFALGNEKIEDDEREFLSDAEIGSALLPTVFELLLTLRVLDGQLLSGLHDLHLFDAGEPCGDGTEDDLVALFSQYGTVARAQVVMDRETGRSRGFGFVEMGSDQEAQAAISALDGTMIEGRTITFRLSAEDARALLKKAAERLQRERQKLRAESTQGERPRANDW